MKEKKKDSNVDFKPYISTFVINAEGLPFNENRCNGTDVQCDRTSSPAEKRHFID